MQFYSWRDMRSVPRLSCPTHAAALCVDLPVVNRLNTRLHGMGAEMRVTGH